MPARQKERRIANAIIGDPEDHTVMDETGAVRSVQAANVTMPEAELANMWSAMHLERLARTYWRSLSKFTLGVVRVHYSEDERAVVLITRPFVLLTFHPPEYDVTADRGIVRWRIKRGLLVAQRGRDRNGYLELDVRRQPCDVPGMARIHIEVEVANFYPSLASGIADWFYRHTQSRMHVLATHSFLKSLAKLDLEESRVGRFAGFGVGHAPPREALAPLAHGGAQNGDRPRMAAESPPPVDVTEGATPWFIVVGIAAWFSALFAFLAFQRGRRSGRLRR